MNQYVFLLFFFFKQKTAYEMRISDWSSDVCSSDLKQQAAPVLLVGGVEQRLGFLEDALQSLGLCGFQFAAAKLGFVLQRLPAARKGLSLVLMLIRGEAAALSLALARLVLQWLTLAGSFPLRLLAQFLELFAPCFSNR